MCLALFVRCTPEPAPRPDAASDGVRDAGLDGVDSGTDADSDAGPEEADAGEWIRFVLHGDQIPTAVYFPLPDGGFE